MGIFRGFCYTIFMHYDKKFHHHLYLFLLLTLLTGCGQLDLNWGPLLYEVTVSPDFITPNADGDQDVTRITYSLRRTADVSIYFTDEEGERFYFRQERRRAPGDYNVLWGGTAEETEIVETSYGPQEILSRVLPDGSYNWTIVATDDRGNQEETTGTITLVDGDSEVPELNNFAVVPNAFSPNQDSFQDSVSISYFLTKDVNSLTVYLIDPANPNVKYYISQEPGLTDPNAAGYKEYRYEGDVDKNAEPPPDGTYTVVGEARDRAGNAVRVQRELTIVEGGQPFAEIDQGEIRWYVVSGAEERLVLGRTISLNVGDKLCFRAVVHNYGTTPLRTAGPWPGEEYLFTENRNTLARRRIEATISPELPEGDKSWLRQSGAWRFGINFESTGIDFPFRWAIGRQDDLERRIINGNEQWYLLPNARGKVHGCIEINQPPLLNTNTWWGGLIHEDVATVNNDVNRMTVVVESPVAPLPTVAVSDLVTSTAPITATTPLVLTPTVPITTTEIVTGTAP